MKNPIIDALPKAIRDQVVHLKEVDLYIAEVDPKTLNDNPKNWRVHPRRQRSTYTAFKQKHGWLGFIIYNLQTNHLLDGHMRVDEAIKNKEPRVPVILKFIPEEEENEILASYDNIGLLAKRNNEALLSLTEANSKALSTIKTTQDQKLKQFNKDLKDLTENPDTILIAQSKTKVRKPDEPQQEDDEVETDDTNGFTPRAQEEIIQTLINADVLFPGITDLGLPELISSRLSPSTDAPIRTYAKDSYGEDAYFCISSGPFAEGEPIGTLGFYTEDYRFEDAYGNADIFAEYLRELDPVSILSPDFSTYSDWPLIIRLWNLYRSRWCARFWQELSFNIIPSIQSLGDPDLTSEYVLETLPPTCPVLSIQCRKSSNEGLIAFIKLCTSIRKPEVFLLYGGEEKQKYLHGHLPYTTGKKKIEYRFLPQYTEKRRKIRKRA